MILTFITLTNDINKVPIWECGETIGFNKKKKFFVQNNVYPKRILMLGVGSVSKYKPSVVKEVSPGVFTSSLELPFTDITVSGDDLRPFIGGYCRPADMKHNNVNVVIIQIDRTLYTYLNAEVGPSHDEITTKDTIILNSFHAKDWVGCIAVLGNNFERGTRSAAMYVDYAVNGAPRSKMLREMHIASDRVSGANVSDEFVEGNDNAKYLFKVLEKKKRQAFRLITIQRLSNYVIVPKGCTDDLKKIFANSPADYLNDPYGIQLIEVPVDENGVVEDSDDLKERVIPIFKNNVRARSVILYKCKPSKPFFRLDLSYLFVANPVNSVEADKEAQLVYHAVFRP